MNKEEFSDYMKSNQNDVYDVDVSEHRIKLTFSYEYIVINYNNGFIFTHSDELINKNIKSWEQKV